MIGLRLSPPGEEPGPGGRSGSCYDHTPQGALLRGAPTGQAAQRARGLAERVWR